MTTIAAAIRLVLRDACLAHIAAGNEPPDYVLVRSGLHPRWPQSAWTAPAERAEEAA